jgi:hypothetical protein
MALETVERSRKIRAPEKNNLPLDVPVIELVDKCAAALKLYWGE